MKKKIIFMVFGFGLSIFLSGCIANSSRDIDPHADLESIKTIYVVRQPNDKRGIEKLVASELREYGITASHGEGNNPPVEVDAIVTYVDRWMWDITNYLASLTINVQSPDSGYKLATANSSRTSLARRSPEYVVEEVIQEIFGPFRVQE